MGDDVMIGFGKLYIKNVKDMNGRWKEHNLCQELRINKL